MMPDENGEIETGEEMIEIPNLDRKQKRKEHDAYDTPFECALACAQWCAANSIRIDHVSPWRILDPTAGGGPFVKAARATWPSALIAALDIRPEVEIGLKGAGANYVGIGDTLARAPASFEKVDLVITNPPFALADALLRHLWKGLQGGAVIAFLLPVTFLGSGDRWANAGLFAIAPLRFLTPIVPRPSFLTVDGKETSPKFEAALFVWIKGHSGGATIPGPIRWPKPKKVRTARQAKP